MAQLLSVIGEHRPVGVNEDRSPDWPAGVVGSISHSDHWTIACVASDTDLRSIGIDTEPIMSADTRSMIADQIATQAELDLLQSLNLSTEEALTLIFSAKESFYKCWYPINQCFLEFLDVEIIDVSEAHLTIRLVETPNSGETSLDVMFLLNGQEAFTVAWLEAGQ